MRIVTVCGMGFGTSLMLKMQIEDLLKTSPELTKGVRIEVVAWDIGSVKGQQADIIVASTDMKAQLTGTGVDTVFLVNLVSSRELKEKLLPVLQTKLQE